MKTPYSNIKRDCQYLHNFKSKDLENFIALAKINSGMIVLDAMCGEGTVSKELSKIKGIRLSLLDNSKFVIDEAKKKIKGAEFFVGSILKTNFKESMFDRVVIRNGIYEVPKKEQIKLYREVNRILKKNGLFLNWIPKLNENNQKFFNKLTNKKDALAGYEDLVRNRYLMTKEELSEDLKKVGFRDINFVNLDIYYTLSTKKWCEIDFKGDKNKLNELNEYIRNLDLKHPQIEVDDVGEDIKLKIPALISIAKK